MIDKKEQENKNFLELLYPIPRAEPEFSKVFTSFKLYKQLKKLIEKGESESIDATCLCNFG